MSDMAYESEAVMPPLRALIEAIEEQAQDIETQIGKLTELLSPILDPARAITTGEISADRIAGNDQSEYRARLNSLISQLRSRGAALHSLQTRVNL